MRARNLGRFPIFAQQQILYTDLLLTKVRRGPVCHTIAVDCTLTACGKAGLGRIAKDFLTVNRLGIAVIGDVLRPPILARLVRLCQNRACRGNV